MTRAYRLNMMTTDSYLHLLDGRLRIKVPVVKGDTGAAREIEDKISELSGIVEVSANPTTGNVLIFFDQEKTGHTEIVAHLSRQGYLAKSEDSRQKVSKVVAESLVQSAVQVALERLIFALV